MKKPLGPSASNSVIDNMVKVVHGFFEDARMTPIGMGIGILSFVSTILSIVEIFIDKDWLNFTGPIIDLLSDHFPGQLILFSIIAFSISFTVNFINLYLTMKISEARLATAHALTALSAFFINLWISRIFEANINDNAVFVLFFTALATGLFIYIGKSQYKSAKPVGEENVLRRVDLMLNFTFASLAAVAFFAIGYK